MKLKSKYFVFFLTFISYVCFHASRKSFSAIKGTLQRLNWFKSSFYPTEKQVEMFGLMDTLFMSIYSMGLFASGVIGDRFNKRRVISFSLATSSFLLLLFGLGGYLQVHELGFYSLVWSISGLIQSLGWPTLVAVMANWFGDSERGVVLGIWSSNANVGNILGTSIVTWCYSILGESNGWKFSLIVVSILMLVASMLILWKLNIKPNDMEISNDTEISLLDSKNASITIVHGISFCNAWKIPGVLPYSISYACLKSVNYTLLFWLPFYLSNSMKLDEATADDYSMLYDIGQIFGALSGGYLSDRIGVRSPIIVFLMLLASAFINCLRTASENRIVYYLFVCGILVGGPANLISTAVSADLGLLTKDKEAQATVAGIIDGIGSLGASVTQLSIGYLSNCHIDPKCDKSTSSCKEVCHWKPVFTLLTILSLCSCASLSKVILRDLKKFRNKNI